MVSLSRPSIEPLLSMMNTSSVVNRDDPSRKLLVSDVVWFPKEPQH